MSEKDSLKSKKSIHLLYSAVLAVLVFVTGIAFIFSCLHIYKTGGEQPYSYDTINAHFKYFAIPSFLTIAGVIGGIVIELLFPLSSEKEIGRLFSKSHTSLEKRINKEKCTVETTSALARERKITKIFYCISAATVILSIIISLIFALDFSRYGTDDINGDILSVCIVILPLAVIAISVSFICSVFIKSSSVRRVDIIRKAIKNDPDILKSKNEIANEEECGFTKKFKRFYSKKEEKILLILRCGVLVLAVTFIILGISNGGMAEVLGKAVRICTECIGLG